MHYVKARSSSDQPLNSAVSSLRGRLMEDSSIVGRKMKNREKLRNWEEIKNFYSL